MKITGEFIQPFLFKFIYKSFKARDHEANYLDEWGLEHNKWIIAGALYRGQKTKVEKT